MKTIPFVLLLILTLAACQRPTVSSSLNTSVNVAGKGMAGSVGVGISGRQPHVNVYGSGTVTPRIGKK